MDARYAIRNAQLLAECEVAPEVFEQVMPRLHTFMEPFVATFGGQALHQHATTYIHGLLSDVERQNVESIAYHFQRAGKRLRSIQVSAFQFCEQELPFFFERALRMILRRWRAST